MPADLDSLAVDPSNENPLADDSCVVALQEYQALLEAGRRPDRATFLTHYPDASAELTEAMDGLDFLYQAVGSSRGSGGAASTVDGRPVPSQLGDFRIIREVG